MLSVCEDPALIPEPTGNEERGRREGEEEGECPKGASMVLVLELHWHFMSEPRSYLLGKLNFMLPRRGPTEVKRKGPIVSFPVRMAVSSKFTS